MAVATVKLTTAFADETERVVEMGPFDVTVMTASVLRANVRTFNADIADIENLYISEGGAKCTGITGAKLITTVENEINLN